MKRTERHHLKENEFVHSITRAKETFETYRKPIFAGGVGLLVVVAAVIAGFFWRQQVGDKSRILLAEATAIEQAAVLPPAAPGQQPPTPVPGSYPDERAKLEAALKKYLAVADGYPSSASGIAGRYHAAGVLVRLGRNRDAAQRYQEVVDRAGDDSIYRDMARLGLADVEAASGQYDKAIAVYQDLSGAKAGSLPVDGILMQLARAQTGKGSPAEAKRTYQRIADEFPQSPYSAAAKRELGAIKIR